MLYSCTRVATVGVIGLKVALYVIHIVICKLPIRQSVQGVRS